MSHPRLVSFFCAMSLGLWAMDAFAQSACEAGSLDAFSMARQSRRIVDDYRRLHEVHRLDMDRLGMLYWAQTLRPKPWRFGVAGLFEYDKNFGFDACTNQGNWDATLNPWLVGGLASFQLESIGLGVEGFALLAIDRLEASPTLAQTQTPDGGVKDPTGLASLRADQTMFGGRLSYRDWATAVVGVIQTDGVDNITGEDGRAFIYDGPTDAEPDRWYLGAGVPRFNAYAHIIFDERDVRADQFDLSVQRLPLPYHGLRASLGVGYLDDEEQATLDIGVSNILGYFSVDMGFEHRPLNVRHVRARAEYNPSWGWEPADLAAIEPGLEAYPRFAFDAGAFVETSWFQSRYLADKTGEDGVWGASVGAYVQPDLTIFVNRIDLLVGVNQPENIERLSEMANHWHLGVRLYSRLGL